jgi:hypothetical protein
MGIKYKYLLLFVFFLVGIIFPRSTQAIYNPTQYPNNRFGIHLSENLDLVDAAKLVNSSGGDWGYVTLVIRKDERDTKRWQKVFDEIRRNHLIPIVRIATQPLGDTWVKPSLDEIDGWVDFLNSLNWVIENRYVIIGNEPNHAKEWGGEINPGEYANYLQQFSLKLKNVSSDFYVLGAGLDASAPNGRGTMDEGLFIRKILISNPSYFEYVDGWVSHSYPNPAFSGSEYASGKGSVKTFEWELTYLQSLGVKKELPIFITETGWVHNQDEKLVKSVGKKLLYSFNNVWNKENIVCVTPFILNYTNPPFNVFSWKSPDGGYYPFYFELQNEPKLKGVPILQTSGVLKAVLVNPIIAESKQFVGFALAENTGQSIWNMENTSVVPELSPNLKIDSVSFAPIEPFKQGVIVFRGEIINKVGLALPAVNLAFNKQSFTNPIHFPTIILPKLWVKINTVFAKIQS